MDLSTMLLTTFAGSGTNATSNGIGVLASFNRPAGIAVDKTFIYVTEFAGNVVRRIDIATATVTIFAGSTSGAAGFSNGIGNAALFNGPHSLAIDPSGLYLYVADSRNARIRRIEISTKTVTTIAGNGVVGCIDGSLVSGSFSQNEGLAVDPTGASLVRILFPFANSLRSVFNV
jgi:DNA-binding beta-propeller fold protein YncE